MPGKSISDNQPSSRAQVYRPREPLKRPPPPSVLAAELLRVEKALDHHAADVLDRRNLSRDR
jgi:hypothetical protein